ncbi:MAG: YCF48-related protein [Bacteroidales bacterium]|nr:YCF48-related protein [Bacteroidales bacterium]
MDDPDPIDPNPIETENCFNAIDISNTIDYARSINFINPTEGWLFGRGVDESSETTLLHTEDGGLTWSVMNTDFKVQTWGGTSEPYFDFHNSTGGYMIEKSAWITGMGNANRIKHTTDKGQTWTEITDAAFGTWDVLAVNSTDAVFIGHDIYGHESNLSVLYRVSNTTHEITQTIELPVSLEFNAEVDMSLSEDGVINLPIKMLSGDADIYMARSADFGLTWTYTALETSGIYDVNFPTNNTGYVLAPEQDQINNTIFKTTDGGITWTKKPLSANYSGPDLYYINFFDAQNGLGVGASDIYKTTNGGETWTAVSCFNDSDYHSTRGIAYVSLDKWYAPTSRYVSDGDETYTEFVIYEEE